MADRQPWPFGDLQPLSYDVMVADPPWHYQMYSAKGYEKSPDSHYDCMTGDQIKGLPVGQLARGDCLLMLWAVWPMLDLALDVMAAWGFTFKTGGAWHKKTATGKSQFGTGYILRGATEPFLIGTMGAPKTSNSERGVIDTTDYPSVVDARMGRHSAKPIEAYKMIERLVPGAMKRLEVFARDPRPGWDGWGNEYHDEKEGQK